MTIQGSFAIEPAGNDYYKTHGRAFVSLKGARDYYIDWDNEGREFKISLIQSSSAPECSAVFAYDYVE